MIICDTLYDRFQIRYEPLNLNRLQYFIDSGRIDPSKPINMYTLYWSGAVGKIEHGVKLLADVSVTIFKEGFHGIMNWVGHRNDVVVNSLPYVWVFASKVEPVGDTYLTQVNWL